MSEQEDTQAIDMAKVLDDEEEDVQAEVRRLLPDAATIRAVVVVLLVFVGAVVGKPELKDTWVDPLVTGFTVAAPLGLAWWIRIHTKKSSDKDKTS